MSFLISWKDQGRFIPGKEHYKPLTPNKQKELGGEDNYY